jgi:hypothetical protein
MDYLGWRDYFGCACRVDYLGWRNYFECVRRMDYLWTRNYFGCACHMNYVWWRFNCARHVNYFWTDDYFDCARSATCFHIGLAAAGLLDLSSSTLDISSPDALSGRWIHHLEYSMNIVLY